MAVATVHVLACQFLGKRTSPVAFSGERSGSHWVRDTVGDEGTSGTYFWTERVRTSLPGDSSPEYILIKRSARLWIDTTYRLVVCEPLRGRQNAVARLVWAENPPLLDSAAASLGGLLESPLGDSFGSPVVAAKVVHASVLGLIASVSVENVSREGLRQLLKRSNGQLVEVEMEYLDGTCRVSRDGRVRLKGECGDWYTALQIATRLFQD